LPYPQFFQEAGVLVNAESRSTIVLINYRLIFTFDGLPIYSYGRAMADMVHIKLKPTVLFYSKHGLSRKAKQQFEGACFGHEAGCTNLYRNRKNISRGEMRSILPLFFTIRHWLESKVKKKIV
jgi:hypothetical protein